MEENLSKKYSKVAAVLGIVTIAIGLIALLGWMTGWMILAKIGPNYIPMPILAAILFTTLGIYIYIYI